MNIRRNLGLFITVIAAASPAIGYGLAYVYQLGYCEFYNIPSDFIILDWTTVLTAVAASFGVLFFLSWIALMFLSIPKDMNSWKKKLFLILMFFVILFIFSIFFLTVEEVIELSIMFGFTVLLILFGPWLSKKISKTNKQKDNKPIQKENDTRLDKIFNNVYSKSIATAIYVIFIIFICVYLAGRAAAMKKDIFYVPSSNPDSIVLKIYGDNIICGEIVESDGKLGLGTTLHILSFNDSLDMTLTPYRINLSFTQSPE